MIFYQYFRKKLETCITHLNTSIYRSRIIADRSELFRLALTKAHRAFWGDSWYRASVLATNDKGEFLLVEELRARINNIWYDVEDMWNIPSGSCREDEQFITAAIREAHEELGRGVSLHGICALKHGKHNDDPCLLIVFVAKLTAETCEFDHKEIKSQRWFSEDAIYELYRQKKLRSADLVLQAVGNYQKGLIMPLAILNEYQEST